ncbi:glycerophosphodiester phosphodiesterase family protein [Parapedobacter sp. 10938]|uniref:glycerophosphodiester phosphodiesterase family protein n=1 Tax=Parapedobacter flavus TaxID=3110225 RepID=UPI002DBC13A0|nr:glycerophosphodiester phosphodiesterase family protein [Parapedobacter sp. 10938]MEC3878407.1 glycerophosphodiester phosphodiesterase family protein [Parapedobacter sp. 10938]
MKSTNRLLRNLLLVAVCCLGYGQVATGQPSMEVFAHRGFRGLHPESTIQGMKKTLYHGAVLEFDLAISRDKKVMVTHDAVMNRKIVRKSDGTPIARGEKHVLYQMDYADIRMFDIGMKPNPDFPEQERYPAYIPLLGELVDSVETYAAEQGLPVPRYFIETKLNPKNDGMNHPGPEEFVDLMMQVVEAKGIRDRIIVQSFDPRTLQVLRRKFPDIELAFLAKSKTTLESNLEWLGFTPDFYSINSAYIDAALVAACKAIGTELIIGNCNDYNEIKRLSAMGVHRVISDFPITSLAAKGQIHNNGR